MEAKQIQNGNTPWKKNAVSSKSIASYQARSGRGIKKAPGNSLKNANKGNGARPKPEQMPAQTGQQKPKQQMLKNPQIPQNQQEQHRKHTQPIPVLNGNPSGFFPAYRIEATQPNTKKLRVAAYCRVSTLLDSQETSIEAQELHYEEVIRSNPEWELAGIYLEAGVSGTKAETRPELQRLLNDCRAGKIDLILTKSISRFARNTSECLEMVRFLKEAGVAIHFDKENIKTDSMESEFMLSILACLAEDESHSISENMKWGIRKRFADGRFRSGSVPYGYRWEHDALVQVPGEADHVRRMFQLCLAGHGMHAIARMLNQEGIPSPTGIRWSQPTIGKILTNPAYKGDMLFQKTYMDEHFMQRKNHGELDQYLNENHHAPIISKEEFDMAQKAIEIRAKATGHRKAPAKEKKIYAFSCKLVCGRCGSNMLRQSYSTPKTYWKCYRHMTRKELCDMKPEKESNLERAFLNCMNKLAFLQGSANEADRILDQYEHILNERAVMENAQQLEDIERKLEENKRKGQRLVAEAMRGRRAYMDNDSKNAIAREAADLLMQKNQILKKRSENTLLQELKAFVKGWKITDSACTFPEEDFRHLVHHCTVWSGEKVTFHFQCGLECTESLVANEQEEEV